MITIRRKFFALNIILASAAVLCAPLHAQSQARDYPSKAIHLIVPFGAGTTTDQAARYIGQRITEQTKQAVIIENKPGANGSIAMQYVLTQPADGYTWLIGTNTTHAANLSLFKKLAYDPVKDFLPISGIIIGGVVLAVAPNNPARSVPELVAMMKKSPGKLTFGSGNSSSRAGGEVMRELAGVDILYVPYKTLPNAIADLMGGQIDMVFGDAPAIMPLVRGGKLRALGVSTKERLPEYKDVPTIAEQGVPGYEVTGWLAAFAPKGTPPDIVAKLNSMVVPIMKSDEAHRYFGALGWTPIPGTQEELAAFQRKEIERWARLVKTARIEPE